MKFHNYHHNSARPVAEAQEGYCLDVRSTMLSEVCILTDIDRRSCSLPEFSAGCQRSPPPGRPGWFWWQFLNTRHLVALVLMASLAEVSAQSSKELLQTKISWASSGLRMRHAQLRWQRLSFSIKRAATGNNRSGFTFFWVQDPTSFLTRPSATALAKKSTFSRPLFLTSWLGWCEAAGWMHGFDPRMGAWVVQSRIPTVQSSSALLRWHDNVAW